MLVHGTSWLFIFAISAAPCLDRKQALKTNDLRSWTVVVCESKFAAICLSFYAAPDRSPSPCRHMLIRVPVGMAVGRGLPGARSVMGGINMRYHATRRRAQCQAGSTFSGGLAGSGNSGAAGARQEADERRLVPAGSNLSGNVGETSH